MIEDRVDRSLVGLPWEEVDEVQTPSQLLENPHERPRFAGRVEDLRHQIEVGVRAFAAQLFEPRGRGEDHVGKAAGRVVHEEVVSDDEVGPGQARGHVLSVGEG